MIQPHVSFSSLLWISVFLSVGGIVIFFLYLCVVCVVYVILDACIGMFDTTVLCTGVYLCDMILYT